MFVAIVTTIFATSEYWSYFDKTSFDADQKKFHAWWFNSRANTSESTGLWDEKTNTLFWTSVEPNKFKGTSQHQFNGNDKYDWKVLVQDKQGVALFRMEGTSLRVRDAKK